MGNNKNRGRLKFAHIEGYHILGEDKKPRKASMMEAHRWLQAKKHVLAYDDICGLEVSTIFCPIGQPKINIASGIVDSVFFETMVFGDDETKKKLIESAKAQNVDITSIFEKLFDDYEIQRRYYTYDEAMKGHTAIIAHIKEVLISCEVLRN
jgi:hypothetical protein